MGGRGAKDWGVEEGEEDLGVWEGGRRIGDVGERGEKDWEREVGRGASRPPAHKPKCPLLSTWPDFGCPGWFPRSEARLRSRRALQVTVTALQVELLVRNTLTGPFPHLFQFQMRGRECLLR